MPTYTWLKALQRDALVMDDQAGFQPIFDGKTLKGWDGDPAFWKVVDGAIVGQSTPENAVKENTFVIEFRNIWLKKL